MKDSEQYTDAYRRTLEQYLAGGGEGALNSAYELGREALTGGLGIFDMMSFHHDAVAHLLQHAAVEEPQAFVRTAASFLIESLTPFEMSHRTVDEANTALRRLNELLEEEAARIAHALHDQAGSILASARLELDLVEKDLPPATRERLSVVRKLIDETGEQMRHLSHELRPTVLDDLGLGPALEFLAQGVEQRSGIVVDVCGRFRERLAPTAETAVYRIVQEALNNTLLHGGTTSAVTISLEHRSDQLLCTVTDDGAGFDVAAVLGAGGRRGLGLLGMRERASAAGGRCDIGSTPGKGTTIEILVPALPGAAAHG